MIPGSYIIGKNCSLHTSFSDYVMVLQNKKIRQKREKERGNFGMTSVPCACGEFSSSFSPWPPQSFSSLGSLPIFPFKICFRVLIPFSSPKKRNYSRNVMANHVGKNKIKI